MTPRAGFLRRPHPITPRRGNLPGDPGSLQLGQEGERHDPDGGLDLALLAVAADAQRERAARLCAADGLDGGAEVGNVLAGDLEDHVVRLEARLPGRGAVEDAPDDDLAAVLVQAEGQADE